MTVQQIMDLALANTHTKSGQVNATSLLSWFNIVRKDLGNAIIADVDENFFYQIWKRDAVASQENGEYPYPEADSDSAGALKINRVAVKLSASDVYYKPTREVKPQNLPNDWEWYLANQPKSDPIHFIADESVFIAPQFASADLSAVSGNKQIKLEGIAKFTDLAANAAASAVLIPDDFHHLISLGLEEYIYKSRGKRSDGIASKNSYEFEKSVMIDKLTNRDNSQMQATVPDDAALQ